MNKIVTHPKHGRHVWKLKVNCKVHHAFYTFIQFIIYFNPCLQYICFHQNGVKLLTALHDIQTVVSKSKKFSLKMSNNMLYVYHLRKQKQRKKGMCGLKSLKIF